MLHANHRGSDLLRPTWAINPDVDVPVCRTSWSCIVTTATQVHAQGIQGLHSLLGHEVLTTITMSRLQNLNSIQFLTEVGVTVPSAQSEHGKIMSSPLYAALTNIFH
jgi:hypothetical protein